MKILQLACCLEQHENHADNNIELEVKPSTSQATEEPIIYVKDAYKHYGVGKNAMVVFDGLNMTVPKGIIYALLGASGCGKTTLLSCILGQRRLNSGKVWILGGPPGTKASGVPGPRVGYMPQETALYGDFTINETLLYFGWIAGMTKKQIQEKSETLKKLFMLPNTKQRIRNLSGGEQRRVSLVSVLLHEPELLILDEPTVGVDPLLREVIWDHLLNICKNGNTTIVMTTHYIEEAKQAHVVGLMRQGELLAEEPPEQLLLRHQTESLEEVFLKLSISQNLKTQGSELNDPLLETKTVSNVEAKIDEEEETKAKTDEEKQTPSNNLRNIFDFNIKVSLGIPMLQKNHMKALIWKNTQWWMRNLTTLSLSLTLAVLLMAATCACIGNEPSNFPLAVVNYETNMSSKCDSRLTCNSTQLSCGYLEHLKRHSIVLINYNSEEEAKQSVIRRETYASIVVKQNYSSALKARIDYSLRPKPWVLENSTIDVLQDIHDTYITIALKYRMYDTFQTFIKDYLKTCNENERMASSPIRLETPVYGTTYPSFNDFAAAGVLLNMIFMLAVILSAYAMFIERNEANLERTFIMGITETELLLAYIFCQFGIVVMQSILGIITTFFIFDITQNGSTMLVLLLTILTGLCGLNYGMFISSLSENLTMISLMSMGTFLPLLCLCGVAWPPEAMSYYLRPFSVILPLTAPVYSIRSILQKSWGLSEKIVYTGFISINIWTIIFLLLSLVTLKYMKN